MEKFLISIDFEQCEIDHCVYIRNKDGLFTAVYVHVDDLTITGNDIVQFKEQISARWEMEDLGLPSTMVGIEIRREGEFACSICQASYALRVLQRFDSLNLKAASAPLPPDLKLFNLPARSYRTKAWLGPSCTYLSVQDQTWPMLSVHSPSISTGQAISI